jgi:hypothetical protein
MRREMRWGGRCIVLAALGCGNANTVADAGSTIESGTKVEIGMETREDPCPGIVGAPMAGHVSWRVNGELKCAGRLYSNYVYEAPRAAFTLQLDTPDGADSLFLAVRSWTSMTLAGTHVCRQDVAAEMREVIFEFRSGSSFPSTVSDCAVTLDAPGKVGDAHASGTFSATATDTFGGAQTVTAGVFDTPTL